MDLHSLSAFKRMSRSCFQSSGLSCFVWYLLSFIIFCDQVIQDTDTKAGAVFWYCRLVGFAPGGAGDIHMCPRGFIFDEMAEEGGGGAGTGVAAFAEILDVGDFAFNFLAPDFIKGHAPEFLAAGFGGGFHLFP